MKRRGLGEAGNIHSHDADTGAAIDDATAAGTLPASPSVTVDGAGRYLVGRYGGGRYARDAAPSSSALVVDVSPSVASINGRPAGALPPARRVEDCGVFGPSCNGLRNGIALGGFLVGLVGAYLTR